jgi:prevent-host-death family protein
MPRIGLRELKIRTSEVLRDVQCNQERYTITNRGVPVAIIIPYARGAELRRPSPEEMTARLDDIAARVTQAWNDPRPVAEIMDEIRR